MEDDLNFFEKGRQPKKKLRMEDDLKNNNATKNN